MSNYQYEDALPFARKSPCGHRMSFWHHPTPLFSITELLGIVLLTSEYDSLPPDLNIHITTLELQVKDGSRLPCNKQITSVINNPLWI
jgi:hypothetical protein